MHVLYHVVQLKKCVRLIIEVNEAMSCIYATECLPEFIELFVT